MPPVIRLHRPWPVQILDMLLDMLVEALRVAWRVRHRHDAIDRLDRRMRADIGLDDGEIAAFEADTIALTQGTRTQVVAPRWRD